MHHACPSHNQRTARPENTRSKTRAQEVGRNRTGNRISCFLLTFAKKNCTGIYVRILWISSSAMIERRVLVAEISSTRQKTIQEKRSYSVAEAAEILGVSKRSIYRLCSEGVFKSVRIGTKLRISKKSFDEWLDGENIL